jgi:hypothetical protein
MAGLDPATHVFAAQGKRRENVDGRVKPGHDDWLMRFQSRIASAAAIR